MPAARYLAASVPLRLTLAGSGAAIPILALQRLDDIAIGGLLVGASLALTVVMAPLVGVVLDRARRPALLIGAAGLVSAAAYAIAAFLGPVPAWAVAIALLVSGAAAPFYFGGLSSFVTQVMAHEARGYATDALSYNIGSVAGPAVTAFAVGAGSAQIAMLVLAGIGLLGSLAAFALGFAPHSAADAEHPRVFQQMRDGLGYLIHHRPLSVVTVSGTVNQLGQGALPVVAVAISIQRAGTANHSAWFVTAFAIGALVGTIVATAVPAARIPPTWQMGVGFAATGLVLLAASVDVGVGATLVLIGVSGLFTAHSTAAMLLLRKQQSPTRLRSQVFTVGSGVRSAASAIGAAIAGFAAASSASGQLAAIAATWVLSGALLLAYPRGAEPVPDS